MPDSPDRNPGLTPQAGDVASIAAHELPALVERVHMDSLDTGTVYIRHAQSNRDIPLTQWRKMFEQGALLPWAPPQTGQPLPDLAPVSLEPQSASAPASGGTGSVTVTITGPGIQNSWSADPQAEATWFHLTDPPPHTPQPANGILHWAADPNDTASQRSAACYINGKTFTLTQDAQPLQHAR